MGTYRRIEHPLFQAYDSNGDPLSGGLVYTYAAGTTTAKATYQEDDTENSNPVVLDSTGRAEIYGTGYYKFVLKTSAGVTIWTLDNIQGIGETSITSIGDYAGDFDAAITAIAATATHLYIDSTATMSADVTVPATCAIEVLKGGVIDQGGNALTLNGPLIMSGGTITNDATLTINGPFPEPGPNQVFTSTGTVSFGTATIKEISPDWWGPDGTADEVQINYAINAGGTGATIRLLGKTYTIAAPILPLDDQTLCGTKLTKIFQVAASGITDGSNGGLIHIAGKSGVTIRDLLIDGNYSNQTNGAWYGIDVNASDNVTIDNVEVEKCRYDSTNDCACIRLLSSSYVKISNCRIDNSNNNIILYGSSYSNITNCSFKGNYSSETVSFYAPTGYTTAFNTLSNCTFEDVRQAILIQGATYTTIDNISIENASDVALAINNGMASVSNVQIQMGSDTANYAVNIGQTQEGDLASDDPIILNNVSVDVNGKAYRPFHIAYSAPDKVTLTNCHAFNTGTAVAAGTKSGFYIQAASNVTLIGCTARDMLGSGFELLSNAGVPCKNIKLIGCSAFNNGIDGVSVAGTAVEHMQIIGGTFKNNSQTSAGTDYGIYISSTGNYGVLISNDVTVFDDQDSPTQHVDGISVGAYSGNLVTGTAPPVRGLFNQGQVVWRKDAADSAAPGWVCVSRVNTQFRVGGSATDTTLEVDSTTGMAGDDIVGIVLDSGAIDWTTIASVTDGDTMVLTAGLSGDCAINNNIYTYRWKAMANLS